MQRTTIGKFSAEQQRAYDRLEAALEAHGYFIAAEPVDGFQQVFVDDIRAALEKVEQTAAYLRTRHGYRGLSANLLRALHSALPNPSFNVEVSAIQVQA